MDLQRWVAVSVLGALGFAGCMKKEPPPPGPVAPPPGMSSETRERMQKLNPDVLFGSVTAVRAGDLLVAVAGIPADQCKVEDTIAFYAADRVINMGEVVRIVNGNLHVKYKVPGVGERAPELGDVAVKVKPAAK